MIMEVVDLHYGKSFKYYLSNPYIGIGAFNFSNYYEYQFNEKLYVHNTF